MQPIKSLFASCQVLGNWAVSSKLLSGCKVLEASCTTSQALEPPQWKLSHFEVLSPKMYALLVPLATSERSFWEV